MDDNAPLPKPTPANPPDPRLQALIQLRDELHALNARLEYAALMLRLARPTLPH